MFSTSSVKIPIKTKPNTQIDKSCTTIIIIVILTISITLIIINYSLIIIMSTFLYVISMFFNIQENLVKRILRHKKASSSILTIEYKG